MSDETILVLPIGGQATRIGGVPKFLLPVGDNQTLIGRHVHAAQESGISEIFIICRPMHTRLIRNYFSESISNITVIELENETQTMNETLFFGLSDIYFSSAIVGLSDTYWSKNGLVQAYSQLKAHDDKHSISIAAFEIREDQVGKLGQVQIGDDQELKDMKDKDSNCDYQYAWGAIKITKNFLQNIDRSQPHIGYTVRDKLKVGEKILCVKVETNYYDCGTFAEYRSLLNTLNE